MNAVRSNMNINLITDVFDRLSDKEKEYIQNSSKTYGK